MLPRCRNIACLIAIATVPLLAQGKTQKTSKPTADSVQPASPVEPISEGVVKKLRWRSVGPAAMSGRISDIAVVENDPTIMYVASASGGLWKTTNNGTTFDPVFDHEATVSIGDVAVAPSDPNLVWVGTGESNNRNSSSWGDGIYKSADGGRSWANVGLKDTRHIGRIIVDPRDANTVYVAAVGHLWGANKERGVFKTVDGGKTWTPSLQVDEKTGATDLAIDPTDPNTLYAAMFQRLRTPYGYQATGPGSGIYKTGDGGKTWRKLTKGLPTADLGRIGIDVYRKNPSILYAVVECDDGGQYARVDAPSVAGGIFRSDDKGETWQRMSNLVPRPFYHGQIRIDPTNDQRVWVLGGSVFVSDDGGKTFRTDVTPKVHGDHHALWIDPARPSHLVLGTDAGVYVTYDGAKNWTRFNTFALGQYYGVAVDMRTPYYIYGGLQDNGVWGSPSRTRNVGGLTNGDAFKIYGGDGMQVAVDPTDPFTIYADWHSGKLARIDLRAGEYKDIKPQPKEGTQDFRYNWNAPLIMSPHDPKTLYFGGNRLFRMENGGERWTAVSPDLTTNDEKKIPAVVWRNGDPGYTWSAEAYCTITTIAESPVKKGLLWVGTDDGNLQVSLDGGQSWTNVIASVPGVPRGTYVSRVEASHFDERTAYVAFDGHRSDDYGAYLFMTTDSGKTWSRITGNLPAAPVYVVREDHRNQNLLFAGTEFGIFASVDRGRSWVQLKTGLPTVAVYDAVIHPRDDELVIGTHGRSIWVLDIAPLQQLTPAVMNSALHLFDIKAAELFQFKERHDSGSTGQMLFTAPNPPFGAVINYYVKATLGDDVAITVSNTNGQVIRRLAGSGYAGIQQVVWDLRKALAVRSVEAENSDRTPAATFFANMVQPGEYSVTVTSGTTSMTKQVIVRRPEMQESVRTTNVQGSR